MSSLDFVEVERLSMETVPLFSVIMPVYNKEPYIRDTIASVLEQTFFSYEVVMIGGVSSDNTDVICRAFAAAEPTRFQFVIQSGKSVANARNDGILVARGKYVAFLDADDLWVPEYLAVMERLIADFPAAKMFIGGHRWKFQDGHVMNRIMSVPRGYVDIFRASMEYDGFAIQTFCVVCDREAVTDIGLFKTDYVIGEDVDLFTRMALRYKAAYEPKLLGTYLAEVPSSLCRYSTGFVVQIPAETELSMVEQTPEIISYHERWILSTVMNNLDRGNHKEAREQLSRITVDWKKHKLILNILSYFPTSLWLQVHEIFQTKVWRHKWDGEGV